jgi:hypothetical protein
LPLRLLLGATDLTGLARDGAGLSVGLVAATVGAAGAAANGTSALALLRRVRAGLAGAVSAVFTGAGAGAGGAKATVSSSPASKLAGAWVLYASLVSRAAFRVGAGGSGM